MSLSWLLSLSFVLGVFLSSEAFQLDHSSAFHPHAEQTNNDNNNDNNKNDNNDNNNDNNNNDNSNNDNDTMKRTRPMPPRPDYWAAAELRK